MLSMLRFRCLLNRESFRSLATDHGHSITMLARVDSGLVLLGDEDSNRGAERCTDQKGEPMTRRAWNCQDVLTFVGRFRHVLRTRGSLDMLAVVCSTFRHTSFSSTG